MAAAVRRGAAQNLWVSISLPKAADCKAKVQHLANCLPTYLPGLIWVLSPAAQGTPGVFCFRIPSLC